MSSGNAFTLIISAPLFQVPPLLQTTRPFAPPGGLTGEATGMPSQLARGNPGGVDATAGIGVTTDNVA
jgi:hypothetical protein